uniref:GIYYIG n=1 Tax=Rhynchosporium graminicola TaxID=2792576 RepID=V5W5M6_9HELO|nr:GIYYIG [Rhynchosporium commune]AHC02364.1 GIYYIG [Rhynchosporium commune]
MTIFNGNISSIYKKEQFRIWLETYNKQYSTNITFKDRLLEPSLQSGWISGFADAEGCFYGRVKSCLTSKLKRAPPLTFQITPKEFYIIKILRDIFLNLSQPSASTCEDKYVKGHNEIIKDLTLKNINYDKSWNGWSFHCSSFTKLKVIRNYFSRYKLKTKKSLAFKKWCKIHDLVLNKKHLTLEGLNKIDLLSKDINKFIR